MSADTHTAIEKLLPVLLDSWLSERSPEVLEVLEVLEVSTWHVTAQYRPDFVKPHVLREELRGFCLSRLDWRTKRNDTLENTVWAGTLEPTTTDGFIICSFSVCAERQQMLHLCAEDKDKIFELYSQSQEDMFCLLLRRVSDSLVITIFIIATLDAQRLSDSAPALEEDDNSLDDDARTTESSHCVGTAYSSCECCCIIRYFFCTK